jgi:hypothetical protein
VKLPLVGPVFPPHVFSLLDEGVTYARVRREPPPGFEEARHFRYPAGPLEAGAGGGPILTREALAEAVKAARALSGGHLARAAVVCPDSWARILPVEVEQLPSDRAAAAEVLSWKLKKLLPGATPEFSLAWEPMPVLAEEKRVLVAAVPRETVDSIEKAFGELRIRVGYIAPASLAIFEGLAPLLAKSAGGDFALLHRSSGSLSFLIGRGGSPIFFRQRPPDGDEDQDRDARLSLSYYAEKLKGAGLRAVYVHDELPGGDLSRIAAFPVPPVALSGRIFQADPGFDERLAARPELLASFAAVYGRP